MKKALLVALLAAAALTPGGTSSASHCIGIPPALPDPSCDWLHTQGSGTISPGLPSSGCAGNQSVSFDGTALSGPGVYSVHFEGSSSICESLSTGAGSGTLSGGITGNVSYSRTENVVTLSGNVSIGGGGSHTILGGACVFVPTSINPVSSYALSCDLVLN